MERKKWNGMTTRVLLLNTYIKLRWAIDQFYSDFVEDFFCSGHDTTTSLVCKVCVGLSTLRNNFFLLCYGYRSGWKKKDIFDLLHFFLSKRRLLCHKMLHWCDLWVARYFVKKGDDYKMLFGNVWGWYDEKDWCCNEQKRVSFLWDYFFSVRVTFSTHILFSCF